jgi:GxxExxY protein
MNANERELIFKDEVFGIISCALEISNGHGHGLNEKIYENSLVVEFGFRGIPFLQQPRYPVSWKQVKVGEFIPDLIAHEKIIVETKTIDRITDIERGQVLNYLRVTKLPLGLIINFKNPRLEWERVVLSKDSNPPNLH